MHFETFGGKVLETCKAAGEDGVKIDLKVNFRSKEI